MLETVKWPELPDDFCSMASVFEKLGVIFRSLLTPLRCGTQWPHGWQHWRRRENRCRRRTRSGKRKTSPTCSAVAAWFRNQLWRVFRAGSWVGTLRKAGRALVDRIIYLDIYNYIYIDIYIYIYVDIKNWEPHSIPCSMPCSMPFSRDRIWGGHQTWRKVIFWNFLGPSRYPAPRYISASMGHFGISKKKKNIKNRHFSISRFDFPMICPI